MVELISETILILVLSINILYVVMYMSVSKKIYNLTPTLDFLVHKIKEWKFQKKNSVILYPINIHTLVRIFFKIRANGPNCPACIFEKILNFS